MEKKKAKRLVLGEGEIVGHKHILTSESDIEYMDNGTVLDFELKSLGILTHDEHARMVFPPGQYASFNQVEFDPFSGEITKVYD